MAHDLVDNFKDGCPGVLVPPDLPYLAREFPLKILPNILTIKRGVNIRQGFSI
jgi:hypothetical protein